MKYFFFFICILVGLLAGYKAEALVAAWKKKKNK